MHSSRKLTVTELKALKELFAEAKFRRKELPGDKNPRMKSVSKNTQAIIEETLKELEETQPRDQQKDDDDYLMNAVMNGKAYGFFDHEDELKGFAIVIGFSGVKAEVIGDFYIQHAYQSEATYKDFLSALIDTFKNSDAGLFYFQPGAENHGVMSVLEPLGFQNMDKKTGFLASVLGKKRTDLYSDPYDRYQYRY